MSLGALGIVFGDIGTSPLYAMREAFHKHDLVTSASDSVMGVLSLILWALIIVISCKYLLYVMRANNNGEGGIIALVALMNPWHAKRGSPRYLMMLAGLFGACLLYGDGTITPAISVLSAIEGLEVAFPASQSIAVPVTATILVALFMLQRHGTGRIGALFGPVMLLWFIVLGVLGVVGIVQHPQILVAANPMLGLQFLYTHGMTGFLVLGTVFLVVTGGEALYADMGHFGISPIRRAWFCIVLPALVLNYFGQGALLVLRPDTEQPFYELAPSWALIPLVGLATLATIIASQAVITGVFSLTRQAVQLGQLPRMKIIQTSPEEYGRVYIPSVNWLLMLVTVGLVIGFKTSSSLAGAYGVAVSTDMLITTVLAFFVARRFDWHPVITVLVSVVFIVVDLAFTAANLFKIPQGGWYPLVIAALLFLIMSSWRGGRALLKQQLKKDVEPVDNFIERVREKPPHRISGTAVFLTGNLTRTPAILLQHLEHHEVLHEQVILVTIITEDVPHLPATERLKINALSEGFYQITLRYGFMQGVNVPVALKLCSEFGLNVDTDRTTYYVGRETVITTKDAPGMMLWQEKIFAYLSRNSIGATTFYGIPPQQVVELGIQVEL